MDLRDQRRVRTPGVHDDTIVPAPEADAIAFLLSHSFPGHRRIVRPLRTTDRKKIRMAMWADSVNERMDYVDRVWRSITQPVLPPVDASQPTLLQVVTCGAWAFPIHLDGQVTRVLPAGGVPLAEMEPAPAAALDLRTA
jgi:hypothetical protein